MDWKKIVSNFTTAGKENAPAILTGFAILGLVSTVIAAYKAAPTAKKILEEKKEKLADIDPRNKEERREVIGEVVKEIVPVVAPTIIMGVTTGACIIGSNGISSKRIKLLSAGYTLAQSSLKELNTKMKETLGDKKTQQVKDAIVKEKLKKKPNINETDAIPTGQGDVLCIDFQMDRPFRSSSEKIGQAINRLSSRCAQEMYVTLNDFYDLLNLPRIPIGDNLGWTADDLVDGMLEIHRTSILNDNDVPCLCIDYDMLRLV